MQPTHDTLSENVRAQAAELLNKHVAVLVDLHAQMKQAHWNAGGPNFTAVHELFDKIPAAAENQSALFAARAGGLAEPRIAPEQTGPTAE